MVKRYNRSFQRRPRYVTNERIRGDEFRVIDEKGEQLGVMSRQDALQTARDKGIDLVLIASKAEPAVVKVIDYHKFLYQEEKKNKESKKGQKKSGTKDIKLSLFAGEQDVERFQKRAHEFLEKGYQVRIKMPLRGRELGKKQMALETVQEFVAGLGEVTAAVEPKIQGRVILAIVARKK